MTQPRLSRDHSSTSRAAFYVEAQNLTKFYKGKTEPAVHDCSLTVAPGELIAVVGHNGAGKSTLFDILGGLTKPDSGKTVSHIDTVDIGWCPQREIVDWSLTVSQNISLGLDIRRPTSRAERARSVAELAAALGLSSYLNQTAETLSGGELRRTQIARAMAGDPHLMILDEPTTGLDPAGIRIVFEYLERRRAEGASALISTHETSRFAAYCSRVIAIRKGQIIADEPVEVFMTHASNSDDLWDAYEALAQEQ